MDVTFQPNEFEQVFRLAGSVEYRNKKFLLMAKPRPKLLHALKRNRDEREVLSKAWRLITFKFQVLSSSEKRRRKLNRAKVDFKRSNLLS
jgi:hypothetical protein